MSNCMYAQLKTGRGHDLFTLQRFHAGNGFLDGQIVVYNMGIFKTRTACCAFWNAREKTLLSPGAVPKYLDV